MPFTSFSIQQGEGGDVWFALDDTRPLAVFTWLWTNWTSVRKVKEGETTNDVFAFLTTDPNDIVGPVHPKAMPVIQTTPDQIERWMTSPQEEALTLQRPVPDGALNTVARGKKEDSAGLTQSHKVRLQRLPWHFLYFFPEPQGHGSFTPILRPLRCIGCGAGRRGNAPGSHCGAGGTTRK